MRSFYPRHLELTVTSLEQLFRVLARLIDGSGPTAMIREVVIVAHGNSWGVNASLTDRDHMARRAGEDSPQWYASDIAELQLRIKESQGTGKPTPFEAFAKARSSVVRRLDASSWVTVRACNFGFSPEGMYSLWAMFGGRANLYAVRAYMAFAAVRIDQTSRIPSEGAAIDYLAKQGLLGRPVRGQARSALQAILSRNGERLPIQFFIPEDTVHDLQEGMVATLVSTPPRDPNDVAVRSVDEVVVDLNAGRSALVVASLEREGVDLGRSATIRRGDRPREWVISGRLNGVRTGLAIRETFERLVDGSARRELKVFRPVSTRQQLSSQLPWTMYGTAYDLPGTEIQAYLDQFSIDDLTCLQDAARSAAPSTRAIVLEHAQRSIERRPEFSAWFTQTRCHERILATNDPLFGPENEPSCYWSPHPAGYGLHADERDELQTVAHTNHNGYQMWADVKAMQAPLPEFKDDIFLEHDLPSFARLSPEQRADALTLAGVEAAEPASVRRARGRSTRGKDEPRAPAPPRVPSPGALRGLSDEDLLKALAQILAQRDRGAQPFGPDVQSAIDYGAFAVDQLISVIGEIRAWAPALLISRISSSPAWELGESLWSLAIAPVWGMISTQLEFYRWMESDRAWGMRAALSQTTDALLRISWRLREGKDVPGLTIPAVTAEARSYRDIELRRYVNTAQGALVDQHWVIHDTFIEGYDFVVAEMAKLVNVVVQQTDQIVREDLRQLGLTEHQVDLVIRSGVIDMRRVYAVTLDGLARVLKEQASRVVVE